MALTYRGQLNRPLTSAEIDANFAYFTGSHSITGSLTISGAFSFDGGGVAQSIPNSSGDGLGASTLELTPDINLETDQYIVLDPTSPNHIHVRAGGTIDESTALLYLGGEKANVLVTDSNHQVQINTTSVDSSSFSWTFDNQGNTLFPTLTTPRGDTSGGTLTTNTLKLGDGTDQAVISTPDGILPNYPSERLVINPGQGSGSGEGGDIYLWAGRGGVDGGSGGDIKIRGGYGPLTGDGGYIRVDGGDTVSGSAGYVLLRGGDSQTGQGGNVNIYGGFGNGNTQNGNVTITNYDTVGSSKTWTFNIDGNLNVPGDIIGALNLPTTGSNTFIGNQIISGSIITTASVSSTGGFTGSLLGTSSWASNAVNAQTASFLPVGTYNITSSWATNALTASRAILTTQSTVPVGAGVEGELIPVNNGGAYFLYMYIGGAWRSSSFN